MNEIDRFLSYIFKDIDNDNVHLYKKIKQSVKTYYLNIINEQEIVGKGVNSYSDITILLNFTDNFIEISSSNDLQIVTVEDPILVKKWASIFEKYLSENLDREVNEIISSSLTNNKSLLRDYKLTRIDERL